MDSVIESSKDYVAEALVSAVDHMGSMADKLSKFLDEKVGEIASTRTRFSCVERVYIGDPVLVQPFFILSLEQNTCLRLLVSCIVEITYVSRIRGLERGRATFINTACSPAP